MKTDLAQTLIVRRLGHQEYTPCWQAMQQFTQQRNETTVDELWLLEHPPVFTLGQSGNSQHILNAGTIPVVQIDRGGQVTYHGPGQLIAYTLVDIHRKQLSIRQLVTRLELAIVDLLASHHIQAETRCKAPGVYVQDKKICSIGLRIRRGYAFHGLALNVAMDLTPFNRIHPCGYQGLEMTQLADWSNLTDLEVTGNLLVASLAKNLDYVEIIRKNP